MQFDEFKKLIGELTNLPTETEWVEFKLNQVEPDEIGRNISALANSCALLRKKAGYIVWGIHDESQNIMGTRFKPEKRKIGNEELENWLLRHLNPRIDFRIHTDTIDNKKIVVFEIPSAPNRPVSFRNLEYIRIGSYTKKLIEFPEKERVLWRVFDQTPFESGIILDNISDNDIINLIDYPKYFLMMRQNLPDNRRGILDRLLKEGMIRTSDGLHYDISNIGAILFGRDLNNFGRLARKGLRVIIYKGNDRMDALKEITGTKGYAAGFEGAIRYINDQLPQNEQIGQALRKEVRTFPEEAIRELVANALIHQDFFIAGSGPMVEIFKDRMEITNPGKPLIDTLRFIDEPPKSRNELLAAMMRRMGICEERGSGIDKVIFSAELYQLPAPDFRDAGTSTVAVLFGPRKFSQMSREERIRACYQHACLQHVSGRRMSNSSLRKRLGIKDNNYPMASRIIRDAREAKLIRPYDTGKKSKKGATYVPFWA